MFFYKQLLKFKQRFYRPQSLFIFNLFTIIKHSLIIYKIIYFGYLNSCAIKSSSIISEDKLLKKYSMN